jgi:hypothetical protein
VVTDEAGATTICISVNVPAGCPEIVTTFIENVPEEVRVEMSERVKAYVVLVGVAVS